jgi:hypothetical protein
LQHAQSRARSRRWRRRATLTAAADLIATGVWPALAASWSPPVQLPGPYGRSVAVNAAGAMAAGGIFVVLDLQHRRGRCRAYGRRQLGHAGSHGGLADLRIAPGHAVLLAAGAISTEAAS